MSRTVPALPPFRRAGRGAPAGGGPRLRVLPLALVAATALAAGAVAGSRHVGDAERLGDRYVAAWSRGDYGAMHALLSADARRRAPRERFVGAHRRTAATATASRPQPAGPAFEDDGAVAVPVTLETRIFGTLRATVRLPVVEDGGAARIDWKPYLAFPALRPGEALRRRTTLPPRADLLARDGTLLAGGADRTSAAGPSVASLVGTVGPAPPERAASLYALGLPEDATVGLSGLERWLDAELMGRPGGQLRAGRRVLARTRPRAARDVRSSIDLDLQAAAETALAGRLGGVAAMRPRSGEILALAGLAASAPQPPGSTFKIVTLAGALEAGIVRRGERFPVQTFATLSGVPLQNANGEACGGTLREAFAHSCNSVFAPLGAELGARRLVRMAERFGFNRLPPLPGTAPSTLPDADDVGDDLAVGSTAIGQGRVLATTLQMAWMAATIANRGERVAPSVRTGGDAEAVRILDRRTARFVARGMRAVVEEGTGQAAAIPGVRVAGKTGTAELRTTQTATDAPTPGVPPPPVEDLTDTDAWFTAFAPASDPEIAVAVLLVGQGAGGTTAAPAARIVLEAALG